MKGIVAFDSVYGNTKKVAEAIAGELRDHGHEVELIDLGIRVPKVKEGDIVLVGSPTRMGRMTGRAKKFVKKLDREHFASRPVAVFDTVLRLPSDPEMRAKALRWTEHGAAIRLKELAQERGLKVHDRVLRVEVVNIKGPLVPEAGEQAKAFVRELMTANK